VYKGYSKLTGMEVAVKVISIRRLDRKAQANLESEISILRRIRHDNIVRLLDVQVGLDTGCRAMRCDATGLRGWEGGGI
jgi:serine/threonine protein kinase